MNSQAGVEAEGPCEEAGEAAQEAGRIGGARRWGAAWEANPARKHERGAAGPKAADGAGGLQAAEGREQAGAGLAQEADLPRRQDRAERGSVRDPHITLLPSVPQQGQRLVRMAPMQGVPGRR